MVQDDDALTLHELHIVETLVDTVDITLVHTNCIGVPPHALERHSPRPLRDPREGASLAIPHDGT